MEYKGFTYTPTPKTAWDNLSMLEKSEMMKVAVRNGITDLKTIRETYNEFAGGGGIHIKLFKNGSTKFADNLGDFFDSIKSWDAAAKLSRKALTTAGIGYSLSKD